MKKVTALIIAAIAAIVLTGCASAPSSPLTAAQFCEGNARMATARANMNRAGSGQLNPDFERNAYFGCLDKIAGK